MPPMINTSGLSESEVPDCDSLYRQISPHFSPKEYHSSPGYRITDTTTLKSALNTQSPPNALAITKDFSAVAHTTFKYKSPQLFDFYVKNYLFAESSGSSLLERRGCEEMTSLLENRQYKEMNVNSLITSAHRFIFFAQVNCIFFKSVNFLTFNKSVYMYIYIYIYIIYIYITIGL
jgi:hypothetical protein